MTDQPVSPEGVRDAKRDGHAMLIRGVDLTRLLLDDPAAFIAQYGWDTDQHALAVTVVWFAADCARGQAEAAGTEPADLSDVLGAVRLALDVDVAMSHLDGDASREEV